MHPINKLRKQIVKEEISEQFIKLANIKGKEIKKKLDSKIVNTAPSPLLLQELIRKILTTEDTNKLAELNRKLLKAFGEKYEYIRTLGKGGEAVLILAQDSILQSNLVFKVARPFMQGRRRKNIWNFSLRRFYSEDEDSSIKRRFIRGATLQRSLSGNTNYGYIPSVYSIRENPLCIEMEFSQANNFFDFVQKHEYEDNIQVFYYLLNFVNEIHDFGIIHRDIKPSNILINDNGIPILLDFTTAKQITEEGENLTAVGYQIGTKSWASPKQMIDAGRATFVDDVFSLGLLLYVILTKKIPEPLKQYDSKKAEMIYLEDLESTKGKTKYIKRLTIDIPDKWKDIFKKATAIEEKLRYPLLEDFIRDINSLLSFEEETDQVKNDMDYQNTVVGTSNQYKDLEKRITFLENKFKEIENITKGLS